VKQIRRINSVHGAITVGVLRQLLAGLPDDVVVKIATSGKNSYVSVTWEEDA
jgi:hypothetical protein